MDCTDWVVRWRPERNDSGVSRHWLADTFGLITMGLDSMLFELADIADWNGQTYYSGFPSSFGYSLVLTRVGSKKSILESLVSLQVRYKINLIRGMKFT